MDKSSETLPGLAETQPGRIHPTDAALTLKSAGSPVEGSGGAALGADLGRSLLLLDGLCHGGYRLRDLRRSISWLSI